MSDNPVSWEEIASFIQDAAQQMREFGLTTLDVEHGGSRVRIKIDAPRTVGADVPSDSIAVESLPRGTSRPVDSGRVISSPMIGTFYASPSPGEPPFVEEGDSIEAGQVVGIIEAMKIMNEITSDFDGVIGTILVRNGQAVEYGQTLFEILPNS